jgi:hypothetical protein
MSEKVLKLKIERPDRGPKTLHIAIDLTADEAQAIVNGDASLTGEVWAALLMTIHCHAALLKLPFIGHGDADPGDER